MALNPNIILSGIQPDLMGTVGRANEMAQQRIGFDRQNALAQMYKTQGPGIMAGEPAAMNALAQFDPNAALGIQGTRQNMQATQQSMDMLSREEQRQIQSHAASLSAAERAAEAQKIEEGVRMGMAAQTPQQWDQMMQTVAPELVGQFGQRDMLANRFMSIADILKRQEGAGPQSPEGKLFADERSGLVPEGTFGGKQTPKDPAAEQRIARIMESGVPRETAIGIVDGRFKADRHPTTGALQVVDMASGRVVYGAQGQAAPQGQPAAPTQQPAQAPGLTFGQEFQGADRAFGVGGAIRGALNTGADTLGMPSPFPDVQEGQADFKVLRENLLNDISGAYGRQPPSWLLQEIRSLTPAVGSVFEGPEKAQTKMRAIGRTLEQQAVLAETALQGELSPTKRQELEAQVLGLRSATERIKQALGSFGGATIRPEVADRMRAYE